MTVRFRKVARLLREQIAGGTYPPGTRLPSEKDLAFEFDCGRDTIRDAVALLANEGLVATRRGFRTLVRPRPEPIAVELPPDAQVTTRPVTSDEADELGCGRGVAVFEVRTPGDATQLYRGDLYVLTT